MLQEFTGEIKSGFMEEAGISVGETDTCLKDE